MENIIINPSTIQEALALANKQRLAHKNKWLFLQIELNGSVTLLKSFNLYIQRLDRDGIRHSGGEFATVAEWKACIERALAY